MCPALHSSISSAPLLTHWMWMLSMISIKHEGFAQITIPTGMQWINNENVIVNVNALDMINNGSFVAGNGTVKFSGGTGNNIGGNSVTTFYQLEISKGANSKLSLLSNINIDNQVNFTSGLLDLNQKNLTLASSATLN